MIETPPQFFIYACISFILGIFLGSFFYSIFILFILLVVFLSIIGILWRKKKIVLTSFLIIFFCFGYFYVNYRIESINDFSFERENIGEVVEILKDNFLKEQIVIEINGNRFLIFSEKEFQLQDKIKIIGDIREIDNKGYENYLIGKEISGIINIEKIEVLEENNGFNFKKELEDKILKGLSFNKASILSAMLLGEKDNMSSSFKEKLGFSGLSHMTAISGMHIVVLSLIILELLFFVKRKKAILIMLCLLFLFVLFVGHPASAERAFIMILFIFLAELLGRQNDSLRSLIMAATFILIINPLALKFDLGFQLSFLAVLGIIYFNNFFRDKLSFIKNKYIKDILSITISAQILTFPLIIYSFGYFSYGAFISNLLIIPLLPFIMVLGFLALIFPIFFMLLSFILEYVLIVIYFFSNFVIEINNFSLFFLILIYFILMILIIKRYKQRFEFYI